MSSIFSNVKAHPKTCIGCVENDKYIMISYMKNDEIIEFFMDQTDAEHFSNELIKRLEQNKNNR
jgi:hypothetical protein